MKFITSNAHWLLRIAIASVLIFHGVPGETNPTGGSGDSR